MLRATERQALERLAEYRLNQELERRGVERTRGLAQAEERSSRAFHGNYALPAIFDAQDGRLLDVNDAFARIFGYAPKRNCWPTPATCAVWGWRRPRCLPGALPRSRAACLEALLKRFGAPRLQSPHPAGIAETHPARGGGPAQGKSKHQIGVIPGAAAKTINATGKASSRSSASTTAPPPRRPGSKS